MSKCIVTYAEGAHEELLEVALPTYKRFADLHGYVLHVGKKLVSNPPAWNKVPLLLDALTSYDEVVWFDCDMLVVDPSEDFPALIKLHAMVRHFEDNSEVPNSGVWRLQRSHRELNSKDLLNLMLQLEVFRDHGWYEQAALLTLMGYAIPPEGSHFPDTKCKNVRQTRWYNSCQFMRLCWNSHPGYRADHPRIVHCSYDNMPLRLDVMRALVKDPHYNYPRRESKKDGDDV